MTASPAALRSTAARLGNATASAGQSGRYYEAEATTAVGFRWVATRGHVLYASCPAGDAAWTREAREDVLTQMREGVEVCPGCDYCEDNA